MAMVSPHYHTTIRHGIFRRILYQSSLDCLNKFILWRFSVIFNWSVSPSSCRGWCFGFGIGGLKGGTPLVNGGDVPVCGNIMREMGVHDVQNAIPWWHRWQTDGDARVKCTITSLMTKALVEAHPKRMYWDLWSSSSSIILGGGRIVQHSFDQTSEQRFTRYPAGSMARGARTPQPCIHIIVSQRHTTRARMGATFKRGAPLISPQNYSSWLSMPHWYVTIYQNPIFFLSSKENKDVAVVHASKKDVELLHQIQNKMSDNKQIRTVPILSHQIAGDSYTEMGRHTDTTISINIVFQTFS